MEGICFGLPFFILWFISLLVSWQVALAWALAFFHFSLSAFICSRLLLLRVGRKNHSQTKLTLAGKKVKKKKKHSMWTKLGKYQIVSFLERVL